MKSQNPSWWTTEHESRWDKVKAAFRRDWEQTKHDLGSDKAPDLQQSAADTIKQAAGRSQPQAGTQAMRGYDELEPAFRYGYGAKTQYQGSSWNDDLETRLRADYQGDYLRDREYIRRGYDYP
ncbi:MAG TPA: hypothetical protein VJM11_08055 [Nevskiaceae bacterium]|nr:hypothetical protein [Nevskiaceae bacterium]